MWVNVGCVSDFLDIFDGDVDMIVYTENRLLLKFKRVVRYKQF